MIISHIICPYGLRQKEHNIAGGDGPRFVLTYYINPQTLMYDMAVENTVCIVAPIRAVVVLNDIVYDEALFQGRTI